MKKKMPVMLPSKLKWRDILWLCIIVIIIIFLTSKNACAQKQIFGMSDFIRHQKDSLFSINVPDYLEEVQDLSPQAALQFKNIYNETYMMIVAERKSSNSHLDLLQLQEHFESNLRLNGGVLIKDKPITIDHWPAFEYEPKWATWSNEPLLYLITFVDTPDLLYKIYCWTLASQEEYLADFRKSASSFALDSQFHSKR